MWYRNVVSVGAFSLHLQSGGEKNCEILAYFGRGKEAGNICCHDSKLNGGRNQIIWKVRIWSTCIMLWNWKFVSNHDSVWLDCLNLLSFNIMLVRIPGLVFAVFFRLESIRVSANLIRRESFPAWFYAHYRIDTETK